MTHTTHQGDGTARSCAQGSNRRITTKTFNVPCRTCAPPIDTIRVEGIEFERTQVGSLRIHRTTHNPTFVSAAKARDLAMFLIQNFCAPEDVS